MKLADYWPFLKETGSRFWRRNGPRLGAALAFYTALSLSPLLILVIAMAGLIYGEAAARGEVAQQIRGMVGPEGAQAVQTILATNRSARSGILMTVVGGVTLLIGATGIFAELQGALDTIWDVKRKPASGIWGAIRDRLLSFLMVCGVTLLLLTLLVASAVLSWASGWLDHDCVRQDYPDL